MSVTFIRPQRSHRVPAGGRTLGIQAGDLREMIARVEAGFPFASVERFSKASGLPIADIARLVAIPARTLARRREGRRLTFEESERLLRIAAVFERAVELFEGDRTSATRWLSTPKDVLGGATPFAMARTEIGAREVEDVVGRLEHGVFS